MLLSEPIAAMTGNSDGEKIARFYFAITKDEVTPSIIDRLPQKEDAYQMIGIIWNVHGILAIDVTGHYAVMIKFQDGLITRYCYIFRDKTIGYGS